MSVNTPWRNRQTGIAVHDTDQKQRVAMSNDLNDGGRRKEKERNSITKATSAAVLVTLGLALAAPVRAARRATRKAGLSPRSRIAGLLTDSGHLLDVSDGLFVAKAMPPDAEPEARKRLDAITEHLGVRAAVKAHPDWVRPSGRPAGRVPRRETRTP